MDSEKQLVVRFIDENPGDLAEAVKAILWELEELGDRLHELEKL